MAERDGLFLHEEIMLLTLLDDKGTAAWGTQYSFGMGGAILAELLLDERIRVVTPKRINGTCANSASMAAGCR